MKLCLISDDLMASDKRSDARNHSALQLELLLGLKFYYFSTLMKCDKMVPQKCCSDTIDFCQNSIADFSVVCLLQMSGCVGRGTVLFQ